MFTFKDSPERLKRENVKGITDFCAQKYTYAIFQHDFFNPLDDLEGFLFGNLYPSEHDKLTEGEQLCNKLRYY